MVTSYHWWWAKYCLYTDRRETFLPRCIECRRGLAMRILSVRLSHVWIDKTVERSVQIFIPYERSLSLVYWEEWLVGATPSTWNIGSTGPRWSKIADYEPIIARSASAVTTSKKVQLTLIGSPLYALSNEPKIDDRPTFPPITPKGVSKTQNGRFPWKIALRFIKVCYKVSLR